VINFDTPKRLTRDFTVRLHIMQRTLLRMPSCMSNACIVQNERNLRPHSYTIWKKVYPSFPTRRMVGEGQQLVPEILGQADPVRAKTLIFNRYSLVELQP